jgi:hypothetical protein
LKGKRKVKQKMKERRSKMSSEKILLKRQRGIEMEDPNEEGERKKLKVAAKGERNPLHYWQYTEKEKREKEKKRGDGDAMTCDRETQGEGVVRVRGHLHRSHCGQEALRLRQSLSPSKAQEKSSCRR